MMPHSQIFQSNQKYAVWPPQNAAAPPPPLVPVPHPGRGVRNRRKGFYRTGSGPVRGFKPAHPIPSDSNRSGSKGIRRIHHPKRTSGGGARLTPPCAPLNTTTFLMQGKSSGGTRLTPASVMSPERLPSASLGESAAEEQWGFNGYGSMKGLIRLRPGNFNSGDISGRFEMVSPNSGEELNLDKRVNEQDLHIAFLVEQNLTLKERLLYMERQLDEVRNRLMFLESDESTNHRGCGGGSGSGKGRAENFLAGDNCSVSSSRI